MCRSGRSKVRFRQTCFGSLGRSSRVAPALVARSDLAPQHVIVYRMVLECCTLWSVAIWSLGNLQSMLMISPHRTSQLIKTGCGYGDLHIPALVYHCPSDQHDEGLNAALAQVRLACEAARRVCKGMSRRKIHIHAQNISRSASQLTVA
jgi:hypothetical protein